MLSNTVLAMLPPPIWRAKSHGRSYHRALGARAPPISGIDYYETSSARYRRYFGVTDIDIGKGDIDPSLVAVARKFVYSDYSALKTSVAPQVELLSFNIAFMTQQSITVNYNYNYNVNIQCSQKFRMLS